METGPEKAAVLKTFLDELDAPGIHVNLDPGNMAMVTGENPVESAKILAPYIRHTHLKDGCHYHRCDPEKVYAAFATGGIKQLFAENGTAFMEKAIGSGDINWQNYINTLKELALRIAGKVAKSGRYQKLEPMEPSERRIIHLALQDNDKVTTMSKGTEPNRYVIVFPREYKE